nr:hypothetical protein [Pseudomonadota bacterium]
GPRGAAVHWAAHNIGIVMMVAGLFTTLTRGAGLWTALIPLGGTVIILATLWLAVTIWPLLGRRRGG